MIKNAPGNRRHRLTILAPPDPSVTDDMGQPLDEWTEVTKLWGNVKDATGSRLSALQQVHAEIRSEVRFAWNKDVTDGMRIRHGERTLEIVGIPADPDGNKRDLVCTCREIRP